MKVYDYWMNVQYEGTREECLAWIMQWAESLSDGRKIFRTWREDGFEYYDVGNIYCIPTK